MKARNSMLVLRSLEQVKLQNTSPKKLECRDGANHAGPWRLD